MPTCWPRGRSACAGCGIRRRLSRWLPQIARSKPRPAAQQRALQLGPIRGARASDPFLEWRPKQLQCSS
eukprot:15465450-Alexandrium_andersonii.AAC.1